jgi:hypothetical protein
MAEALVRPVNGFTEGGFVWLARGLEGAADGLKLEELGVADPWLPMASGALGTPAELAPGVCAKPNCAKTSAVMAAFPKLRPTN